MVSFKILAGGYEAFVATYLFTATAKTSTLELASRSRTGINPSWLAVHPQNSSLLYAVNEIWNGGFVQSFALQGDGSLSAPLDTISSGGNNPAHVAALTSSGQVIVLNYSSGNGRVFNTTSAGTRFVAESTQTVTFPKAADIRESNPHQAYEYNGEIFVPDLGADTIWRLVPNDVVGSTDIVKIAGSIPQPKGSGPRHISIYKDRLFVLHELSSTLTVQKIPALGTNDASIIANASIVPSDGPENPLWAAAEILIPPPSRRFPVPYIYVSNRNKGTIKDPRGDSIAIFEHVGCGTRREGLRLVKQVFTGLHQIRGMEFGPAENGGDEYLIAGASEGSGGVVVFQRTKGGRDLKIVAKNDEVGTRTSFVWAK
ncbi:hypothetical protein CC1G_06512 [Coprinopsis cinerea okayama7|uniref:Isomerase YbhE n=1 Tax=Coprinopsis cinerea (strain Okayama-7 / 130 / ATCC MYA-4618 / FGSC 9003) TaxID=240176 RepID=A8NND8_COPC7|nr:hypothetical protein CC1G_06512 [Coprinopsis cinerea okayama7\|eukprot:XP_001835109.1 hypothetical protein CC1G_06512 [Coprinopsis cinerea okayama7\